MFFCTFSAAEPCGNHRFHGGKTFASCTDLPSLNCSLHWNFHSSSQTVDIAFRQSSVDQNPRWISWAINPHSKGMVGSQALVAFQRDDGTMMAYTSPITSYATQLQQGDLSFPVDRVSSIVDGNEMIIFATLMLPAANATTVNHLWQQGPLVGNVPRMHRLSGPNMASTGTLDFLSGKVVVHKTSSRWKILHGVLCILGYCILMPIGALIARHGKQGAGTTWFKLHVYTQCTAYSMGLGGGIVGILLWHGVGANGVKTCGASHQYIGIALLCLGFFQGIIGRFRPHKEDKKRVYFKIFHFTMGYGTIGLSIVNALLGFHMVHLGIKAWPQLTFIVVMSLLGTCALILEGFSWWKWSKSAIITEGALEEI
ncbi:hypothetical protein F3Y22_tig00111342pilonHSYRG00174 [Hibiscus syriacus]|uniref:Cytochrome b561 and DOMON domain-containing protein n=1 Tax=Hibiscus syriacus TaxID=106335 RepID=A0A6A2YP12_HIBSY|nr:cytochrome b561 and DOMON domain-containing protein At5g47530-like [Hibiscus syriacus]KAE8681114.1 hypothetical protein F3Y22_tig00111342pilonHSYRG00174 [Hibiscus syriacus]